MRILLVEDDELLGEGTKSGLAQQNLTVDWVKTRAEADSALHTDDFDVVLLDIGLPDGSGLDLVRSVRARGKSVPILLLTAHDTPDDKVAGLDSGADDDEVLVSMLLRNLLDNAVRYSSPGGRVDWAVFRKPPHVMLEITDSGAGIPPGERHRVFERFRRLPANRAKGAGLGLSIVREIADLYDANILLADPAAGPGLRVLVRFPLASNKGE